MVSTLNLESSGASSNLGATWPSGGAHSAISPSLARAPGRAPARRRLGQPAAQPRTTGRMLPRRRMEGRANRGIVNGARDAKRRARWGEPWTSPGQVLDKSWTSPGQGPLRITTRTVATGSIAAPRARFLIGGSVRCCPLAGRRCESRRGDVAGALPEALGGTLTVSVLRFPVAQWISASHYQCEGRWFDPASFPFFPVAFSVSDVAEVRASTHPRPGGGRRGAKKEEKKKKKKNEENEE